MPATKTATTIQASATNTAGGTTTSGSVDLTTAYGLFISARITNGGTGPTLPCQFQVEASNDNAVWRNIATYAADVSSNTSYDFGFSVQPAVMWVRVVFTGNTDQGVTVEALGHILTDLS